MSKRVLAPVAHSSDVDDSHITDTWLSADDLESLPGPLQSTLSALLNKLLNESDNSIKWPSANLLKAAASILGRHESMSIRRFRDTVYEEAWRRSRSNESASANIVPFPENITQIDAAVLIDMYAKTGPQLVSAHSVELQIVQRWGVSTAANETKPVAILATSPLSTSNQVYLIKVFPSRKGRGTVNYPLMSIMPIGSTFSLTLFKMDKSDPKYLVGTKAGFATMPQLFSATTVKMLAVPVYDASGSVAVLTIWGAVVDKAVGYAFSNANQDAAIELRVFYPSSITHDHLGTLRIGTNPSSVVEIGNQDADADALTSPSSSAESRTAVGTAPVVGVGRALGEPHPRGSRSPSPARSYDEMEVQPASRNLRNRL